MLALFLHSEHMETFVIGVNHKTASLSLRGCMAFAPQQTIEGLRRLKEAFPSQGFVLLSTCNRTELYGTHSLQGGSPEQCLETLLSGREYPASDLLTATYLHSGMAAIQHLFRVTAALDSMLLGEDQILGQVKGAVDSSRKAESLNMFLDVLFRHSITAAKRVKSETTISRNSLSIGSLAVKAAEQVLGDLQGKSAIVVGSGEMGLLAIRNLKQAGVSPIYVTRRTKHALAPSSAEGMPGVEMVDYEERNVWLDRCPIIVSATQCPTYTLKETHVREALQQEQTRVFLDLAVPRDIDPKVGEIQNCAYFDMDHLQRIAQENQGLRAVEKEQAEGILQEEMTELVRWWAHRKAMPSVRRMRANLRRRWNAAEASMLKRKSVESSQIPPVVADWQKAYSDLAGEVLDIAFYRMREHASPEELEVLYRVLNRAFRKW